MRVLIRKIKMIVEGMKLLIRLERVASLSIKEVKKVDPTISLLEVRNLFSTLYHILVLFLVIW